LKLASPGYKFAIKPQQDKQGDADQTEWRVQK
jgi:hypothetical protein